MPPERIPARQPTLPAQRTIRELPAPLRAAERTLCIEMHDVAAQTLPGCLRVLDAVAEVFDGPLSLLVVPAYGDGWPSADRTLCRFLDERAASGDELVLHGFSHRDDAAVSSLRAWLQRRAYTDREGEFAAIPEFSARRRIAGGLAWFACHRWRCSGFVAPAWLMGPGAWAAIDRFAFDYTATWGTLVTLPSHRALRAPTLVYSARSPLRRALSRSWVATWALMTAEAPLLRLALHPADADRPWQRRMLQRRIGSLLQTRVAATLGDAVRSFSATPH